MPDAKCVNLQLTVAADFEQSCSNFAAGVYHGEAGFHAGAAPKVASTENPSGARPAAKNGAKAGSVQAVAEFIATAAGLPAAFAIAFVCDAAATLAASVAATDAPASLFISIIFGTATAASIPKIRMTVTSSTRVNPDRIACLFFDIFKSPLNDFPTNLGR
nr:hypothetical protein [Janthinobacterium psychrotolerans]